MGNPCTNCIDVSNLLKENECFTIDSDKIIYIGPPLPCSTIDTQDNLTLAIQKLDALICTLGAPQNLQSVLNTGNEAEDIGALFTSSLNPLIYTEILNNQVTSGAFIKIGGTSSEFLMADGSVNSSTFVTNLQQAYFGSTSIPQITVNDVLGALTLKTIRTLASSSIQEWWNSTNVLLAKLTGEGNFTITPLGNVFGINVNATGTAKGVSVVTTGTGPGILATTTGPTSANAIIAESGGVAAAMVLRASSLATTGNMLEVYDFSTRNAFITQEGFVNAQAFIKYLGLGTEYLMADGTVTTNADIVANIVAQTIVDGDITHAPAGNAVFDALALKANDNQVIHNTGNETKTGTLTVNSIIRAGGLSTQFLKADGSVDATTYAPLNSPAFTGTPTAPTPPALDNSIRIATTAFVAAAFTSFDTNVVHRTGNETITGTKTFNKVSTNTLIQLNNFAGGLGLNVDNSSVGTGITVNNFSPGNGLIVNNQLNGYGIYSFNTDVGHGVVSEGITGSTGFIYLGLNDSAITYTVSKEGNINANSYIKTGGLVSQFLMADGSVSTISNFIAPTIVDGDTTHAPDGNSVFDALALKANDANVLHTTGNEVKTGDLTINGAFITNGPLTANGVLTATTLVKSGGTAAQYLMADGSVTTAANIIIPATQVTATPHVDYLTGANVQLQLDNTETNVVGLYKIDKTDDKTLKQTGRYRPDTDVSVLSISPADTLNITACDNILFVNEILPDSNANKVPDFLKSFGNKSFVANGTNTPLAANTRGIFYVGLNKLGTQVYQTSKIYDQDIAYLARILVNNTAGVYTIVSFKYFPDLANNRINNRDRFVLSSGSIVPSGAASISFGNRGMSYTKNSINYSNNKLDPNYLTIVDSINPTPMSFLFFLPNITSLAVSIATSTVMDPTVWYTAGGAVGGGAVNPIHYQVYKLFITVTGTIGIQTKASTSNAPAPGVNAIFATREEALAGLTSTIFPDVLPAGDSIALGTFYLRAGMAVNGSTMNDSNDFYFRPFNATASSSVVGVTTHDALSGKNDNPAFQHVTTTDITNWNTAYTNRITSLTTSGTSGAATLIANVLNIPIYSPQTGGTGYIQNQNASAQSATMWINGTLRSARLFDTGGEVQFPSPDTNSYGFLNATNTELNIGNFKPGVNFQPVKILGNSGTPTATFLQTGNVGIGTASPAFKLDVNGDIRPIGLSRIYFDTNGENASNYIATTNDYFLTLFCGRGGTSRIDLATDNIIFSTSATEKMRILANGNVGIGTTSPTAPLEVKTDASNNGIKVHRDIGAIGGGYQGILFSMLNNESAKTDYASIVPNIVENGAGIENGSLAFYTRNAGVLAEKVRILNNGNVGIGTTNPGAKLVVAGALGGTVGSGGSCIALVNTDTGNYASIGAGIVGQSNVGMEFSEEGISRMVLRNGNLGIGEGNPNEKLVVNGSIRSTGGLIYTQPKQIGSQDLNNITEAGFYAGSALVNAPDGGWFFVTVEGHSDASWVHQTATSYGSGNTANRVYTRVRSGGPWGGWQELLALTNSSSEFVMPYKKEASLRVNIPSGAQRWVKLFETSSDNYDTFSVNGNLTSQNSVQGFNINVKGGYYDMNVGFPHMPFIEVTSDSYNERLLQVMIYKEASTRIGVYILIAANDYNVELIWNADITDRFPQNVQIYNTLTAPPNNTNAFQVQVSTVKSHNRGLQVTNTGDHWFGGGTGAPGNYGRVAVRNGDLVVNEDVGGIGTALIRGDNFNYGNGGAIRLKTTNTATQQQVQLGFVASGSRTFFPHLTIRNDSGNVGIGTESPNRVLQIERPTASIGLNSTSSRSYTLVSDGAGYSIFDDTAGLYRTTISPGGNLLVGTTTDNGIAKLQVNGGITCSRVNQGTYINDLITNTFNSSGNIGSFHTYIVNTNAADGTYGLGVSVANVSSTGRAFEVTSNGASRFYVRNDGVIGINNPLTANQYLNINGFVQSIDSKNQYLKMGMENDIAVISTDWFSGSGGAARPMVFYTTGTERMRIDTVGNITVPGTITSGSDRRLKTNIVPLENSLDKILRVSGVKFDRTDIDFKNQIGFIAQDLEKEFPELVLTGDTEEGMKSVNYGAMTAVLVEAIKSQQKLIKKLEKRILKLEAK